MLIFTTVFVMIYQNYIGHNVLLYPDRINLVMNAEYFYDSIFTALWVFVLFTFVKKVKIDRHEKLIEMAAQLTLGIYCIHPLYVKVFSRIFEVENVLAGIELWLLILSVSVFGIIILRKTTLGRYMTEI